MHREHDLLSGSIAGTLARLALPNLFAVLSLLLYHLTDTFFISRLGTQPLAALSLTFPVTLVVSSVALGLGAAMSAQLGRLLGEGDRAQGRQFVSHGLLLTMVVVGVFAFGGALTIDPLFRLLGADEALIGLVHDYMLIWYLGVGLLVLPMVGNQALRATGNTFTPALVTAVAALVNAILDPLLIFGIGPFPRLEMQGAAIATVISWMLTFVVALYMLTGRHRLLARINPARLRDHWRRMLHIARPATLSNLLNPVANGVLIALLARMDTDAVAAFGAGTRIESLLLILVTALCGALTPFIAQNLGAGQQVRAAKALMGSIHVVLLAQLGIYLLLWPLAPQLAALFSTDPNVVHYLTLYLRWVPAAYGTLGVVILLAMSLNAYHRPMSALMLNLARLALLLLPGAWLGSQWLGVEGVFIAIPLANLAMGGACYLLARQVAEPATLPQQQRA
ncbi:MATE family efflux transporter [Ferrimonas balearica]|uniref:MATE family efflux transporter n=1 Tax=Ferrimonas balearica TaxID=44012 RepID=UPI001C99990B|nr:MATE family efflux transporter [Ferrimonas balearica]MBY5992263.1 MATE family efflux transporter [Ferrimonas balearica]